MNTKSLLNGFLIGLVIGFILSFGSGTLMNNYEAINTNEESFIVNVRIMSGGDLATHYTLSSYGGFAVFLKNNMTICDGKISTSQYTEFTLIKGTYILKVYEARYGQLVYEHEVFIGEDMELFV